MSPACKALIDRAKEDRCLLRDKWDEGLTLSGRDQLRLARVLLKVKPATIEKHGRRVPCEPRFELKAKDRRRLVGALLEDGARDGEILSTVPGLTRRTFDRIKADTATAKTGGHNRFRKRCFETKLSVPVVRPQTAFLDASSGGDSEAEKRFRELTGGHR